VIAKKHPRLDKLLVTRELFRSRSKAKGAIMAGKVYVDGEQVDKAGTRVPPEAEIELRGRKLPFVGRGGLKLEKALKHWNIGVDGAVCIDVGASTGGFTDCLLQRGASLVFAVDVGYGQLAWKLRQDRRVVVLERQNARYLKPKHLKHEGKLWTPEFASIDVSFISLELILPPAFSVVRAGAECVALVKPQFEAGPEKVGKGGIVREPEVHVEVLEGFWDFLKSQSARLHDMTHSPITGGEGNIEFLAYFRAPLGEHKDLPDSEDTTTLSVKQIVDDAHAELQHHKA
jgi:23S rRNA (cytidine1920-2'-O)/16S rRNA (cytidine1409-2'-O)-methyltransferase